MGGEALLILEDGLGENHLGPLANRLELDGDDGLLAARRGEVILLVPGEAEDQTAWRIDLQILARYGGPNETRSGLPPRKVLALAHQPPFAADSGVGLAQHRRH